MLVNCDHSNFKGQYYFDVNETATCLSDVMWPYVYLNEGVYKFPFQKNPREKFPEKFDEFPFYLVTMLFTCPITSTVGRSRRLKIVACFQKWEDYLSADCQLEELWWIVEDREGENWENVHPCRPQVRHLDCSQYCWLQIKATQIQNDGSREAKTILSLKKGWQTVV